MEAFHSNIADAEALVAYAAAFSNQRKYRMRKELRQKVGDTLRVPAQQRDNLDCLESGDVFMVFKPDGGLSRGDFEDLRPLLRQALVAGCAALETYVADKAMEYVGSALRAAETPSRLRDIPLSVGRWLDIEESYERKGWGVRLIVEEHFRELSSTSPSQIGKVLSAVGVNSWTAKVDRARGVSKGRTVNQLEAITDRRNRVAHTGDRRGQGRAHIELDEIKNNLEVLRSVAQAVETVFADHVI